jgi:hypothetical protein
MATLQTQSTSGAPITIINPAEKPSGYSAIVRFRVGKKTVLPAYTDANLPHLVQFQGRWPSPGTRFRRGEASGYQPPERRKGMGRLKGGYNKAQGDAPYATPWNSPGRTSPSPERAKQEAVVLVNQTMPPLRTGHLVWLLGGNMVWLRPTGSQHDAEPDNFERVRGVEGKPKGRPALRADALPTAAADYFR